MTGLVKYLSKRLMPHCFIPPVVLHPWQTDPTLTAKVVIDITNHLPRQLQIPDGWEVMQRNGRVWIGENNRRLVQLDVAQYSMLLMQYNGIGASSAPPAEFLRLLCASCRAQQAANQDYFVHWNRHLLASIRGITGVRALFGASAITHNQHFLFFSLSLQMMRNNSWEQQLSGLQNLLPLSWMRSNHLLDSNVCNKRPGTAQVHEFCYNIVIDRMIKTWQNCSDYMRRNMSSFQKRAWSCIGKAVGRRHPGMSFPMATPHSCGKLPPLMSNLQFLPIFNLSQCSNP